MDTWTKNTPDCSLKVDSKTLSSTYYNQIKGAKINTTIALASTLRIRPGTLTFWR